MTLLDHYLHAVALNLPKGSDRADIVAELREHLESTMDEHAAELGHALTEAEQQAVLADFGDPFTVAARYGKQVRTGFAFGPFQLISPEAFPVYIGILLFVLVLNVIIGSIETLLTGASLVSLVRRLVVTMLVLFAVFTLVFAGIDFFLRRAGKRQRGAPETWLFFTPYLKYVPKWYSASGLVFMSAVALAWGLWWSVWPEVPALLVGHAADALELSASWQRLQSFLLALLMVGIAQRAFSLVRPDLNWLPWVVRLVINALCVAMLYPILDSAPFVVAPDAAAASAETVELAQHINEATAGFLRGFGFYWAFNTLWIALVCAGHLVYRVRRRRPGAAESQVSSPRE
jgi:HAAS